MYGNGTQQRRPKRQRKLTIICRPSDVDQVCCFALTQTSVPNPFRRSCPTLPEARALELLVTVHKLSATMLLHSTPEA